MDNDFNRYDFEQTGETFSSAEDLSAGAEPPKPEAPSEPKHMRMEEIFSRSPEPRHARGDAAEDEDAFGIVTDGDDMRFYPDEMPVSDEPTRVVPDLNDFSQPTDPEDYGDDFYANADRFEHEAETQAFNAVTPRRPGDSRSSREIAGQKAQEKQKRTVRTVLVTAAIIIGIALLTAAFVLAVNSLSKKPDKTPTIPTAATQSVATFAQTEEPQPETEAEDIPETEAEPEPETEAPIEETEEETEAEIVYTEPEPETEEEPETEAEPEPEPETESEPEPEFVDFTEEEPAPEA